MSRDIVAVREALMAEALKDMDELIQKVSNLDASLAVTIEKATKEAAGKAYYSAHLTFKSMMEEREQKLLEAGRHAAAIISTQLNTGITQLIAVNEALEKKACRFLLLWAGFALLGGAIGGVVAVKMLVV